MRSWRLRRSLGCGRWKWATCDPLLGAWNCGGLGVGADGFEAQMLLARHLNRPPGDVAIYLDCRHEPRLTPPLHQAQARELEASMRRLGVQCSLHGPHWHDALICTSRPD